MIPFILTRPFVSQTKTTIICSYPPLVSPSVSITPFILVHPFSELHLSQGRERDELQHSVDYTLFLMCKQGCTVFFFFPLPSLFSSDSLMALLSLFLFFSFRSEFVRVLLLVNKLTSFWRSIFVITETKKISSQKPLAEDLASLHFTD